MQNPEKPVWFITGCSTGFGREIARMLLEHGYRVVVTARRIEQIADLVEAHAARALALGLDVTRPDQVEASVRAAQDRFGQIDVLVNNAGVGYFGAVEESDEHEVRRMFEINFWGLSAMTRAVLPGMRRRRSGHIVNISSIGGLRGSPAVGYYNATKFAVEGLSEALSHEVAPLGIKVLLVEPSGFRTDWAGRSASEASNRIEDYEATSGKRARDLRAASGNQEGDPVRAADAIIKAVEAPNPPLRLLLGQMALQGAHAKLDLLRRDFDAWAEVTKAADAPAA